MKFNQKAVFVNFIFVLFILFAAPIHSQQEIVKDTSNIPIKTPKFSDQILVDLWGQNLSHIYNLNSGYVGIGTPGPTSKLTIWGSGWNAGGLEINNGSGYLSRISSAADGLLIRNFSSSSTSFSFRNSIDAKLLTINSNGNIGIGTMTPEARLNVLGGNVIIGANSTDILGTTNTLQVVSDAILSTSASVNASLLSIHYSGSITASKTGTGTYNPITFRTGGSDRMRILTNGNVLINKLSQQNSEYKLDVVGKIHANEIIVDAIGADFVFEDGYKLKSLYEVELFIKENNHLPEIPNAKDMQENGMSLSEMNTKLLQKVEELTLYIIDQEKRIQVLENKK
ncbi:MAG: hypothetical protein IH620_07375 [Ignavibacterium sp.]|nr:hypothetical protein [Ignavibacterium sp.]